MTTLVAYFVVALFILSLVLIVAPPLLLDYIHDQAEAPNFRVTAVTLRVILGAILLVLADASRFPLIITLLGALSLVSGIVLAFLPRNTFVGLIRRLTGMKSGVARVGGLGALIFAWFLVYAIL